MCCLAREERKWRCEVRAPRDYDSADALDERQEIRRGPPDRRVMLTPCQDYASAAADNQNRWHHVDGLDGVFVLDHQARRHSVRGVRHSTDS